MKTAPHSTRLTPFAYRIAQARQRVLVERRLRGELPDVVWYLEHPPVVTWSRGRGRQHLRALPEHLASRGIAIEETDRGGDVTYHGPGQLVGYPIVDLGAHGEEDRDLHGYMRRLEEALIELLSAWRIWGSRIDGRTGVWVGEPEAKIAAIGVRARRWVTSHGFALNVSCDLAPFRELIVPCGIADADVTSMLEQFGSGGGIGETETTTTPVPTTATLLGPLHSALERALGRQLAITLDGERLLDSRPEVAQRTNR